MKIKNVSIGKVKAGPADDLAEGEFLVYPSTFTRTPDSYGDVIAKGAFAETIKAWIESGNTLPGLYGHRLDDPDFFVAGAAEMGEDEHGWWIKGAFDLDSPKGAQVYRLVKGRRLNQLSFAYDVLEEGAVEIEGGETANELRKLNVYEFSFVPVGANQDTSVVAVKAAADALLSGTQSGRNLPTKSVDELRAAHVALGNVLTAISEDAQGENGKASGEAEAKSDANDEEPSGAKSSASDEEPKSSPSARVLAAHHSLILEGIAS